MKMKPTTSINRQICKVLAEEIMEALQPLAEKHGLVLERKNGKYDASSYTLPITFAVQELKENKAENDFAMFAAAYDVDPTWFGKSFRTSSGKKMTIVGLNTRAPKNCINLQDSAGEKFKCAPAYVRQFLD